MYDTGVRVLGLDYGRKRIGLALSDPLGWTAQPYGYIARDKGTVDRLAEIVREREVSELVLGYPRKMSGEAGDMAQEVDRFAEKLREGLKLPVHLVDERLTTAASERLLIEANVRRKKRKEVRDQMAAALILQGFLNRRRPESPS